MDRNQEIMDHPKEEMIKHLESAVKEFKDFDRLLWLNNHICRPPYDDDIKGFLNRAKERIYSATRADFESAYDECIKSGIEVPNGCDVIRACVNIFKVKVFMLFQYARMYFLRYVKFHT